MELETTIKLDDNPTPTFLTEIAAMHGDDGTEGSIAIVSAPFGTQEEGTPYLMGTRASQYVVFEHEGRRGRFDLAELFMEWVDELGDSEPVEDPPLTEEEMNERIAADYSERRARLKGED